MSLWNIGSLRKAKCEYIDEKPKPDNFLHENLIWGPYSKTNIQMAPKWSITIRGWKVVQNEPILMQIKCHASIFVRI